MRRIFEAAVLALLGSATTLSQGCRSYAPAPQMGDCVVTTCQDVEARFVLVAPLDAEQLGKSEMSLCRNGVCATTPLRMTDLVDSRPIFGAEPSTANGRCRVDASPWPGRPADVQVTWSLAKGDEHDGDRYRVAITDAAGRAWVLFDEAITYGQVKREVADECELQCRGALLVRRGDGPADAGHD